MADTIKKTAVEDDLKKEIGEAMLKVNKLSIKWGGYSLMKSETEELLQDTLQSLVNLVKKLDKKA